MTEVIARVHSVHLVNAEQRRSSISNTSIFSALTLSLSVDRKSQKMVDKFPQFLWVDIFPSVPRHGCLGDRKDIQPVQKLASAIHKGSF